MRIIDAEELDEKGIEFSDTNIYVPIEEIWNAPTVDAVEVVRCKDCKHYVLHALACRHENFNGIIHMNGFCSYGERKDNA